ncbi:MAG: hypothetical protein JRH11_27915, partial [Deltaproteobacteria bacterium]|nr:hypothetical protein [Deltaproteobacteria bacterium]
MNGTDSQTPEEDDASVFLRRFLDLVARGKWIILGTTLIVTVAATFWTLRQAPVFQADCVIEYDTQPPRPLGTGVEEVHGESHYWLSREFFDTQNEVIASRRVAELTVLSLSLHLDPDFMGVPEESLGDWTGGEVSDAALILQGMLTVVPDDATRLVSVRIRAGSGERAAALANGIADAYVARSVESRSASTVAALRWLGGQLDGLGVQLSDAELALHEFRTENDVLAVSLEDLQNLIVAELEAFHHELTTARAERIELAAAHRLLREAGRRDPMDMPGRIFEESLTIERLRQQIQERTAELATLSGRYGASHPQITALTLEVDELRSQLRGEVDNFVAASGIRLRATDERIAGLSAVVEGANDRGLALNLKGIDFRRLHRDQESKERLYNLVLQRVSETNVTSSLESSHASILDRALIPTEKVSPSMSKNAALGVCAGLLLGFMFTFLRETLSRSVATVEDVEALGLSVLGIFPRTDTTPRVRRRGFRLTNGGTPMAPVENANLISHTHPASIAAECCKTIRTNLMFQAGASSLTTLLVTSPNSGEGKTTVST